MAQHPHRWHGRTRHKGGTPGSHGSTTGRHVPVLRRPSRLLKIKVQRAEKPAMHGLPAHPVGIGISLAKQASENPTTFGFLPGEMDGSGGRCLLPPG